MIPVIGVNGRAQHGKDTVVKILHDLYGYERIAFADTLKAVAHDSMAQIPDISYGTERIDGLVDRIGWERAKENHFVRELLQGLGVAAREHIHENVWVEAAFHNAPRGKLLAVSDMRFPNEYQAVKQRGGITIRVIRPGIENVNEHVSETALDNHVFDYYIRNDGTLRDLADRVIEIVDIETQVRQVVEKAGRA